MECIIPLVLCCSVSHLFHQQPTKNHDLNTGKILHKKASSQHHLCLNSYFVGEPGMILGFQWFSCSNYYYYYNHFITLCLGLPGWVSTSRINHSGFCWSRDDGVAVASAEQYASYLHFAPEDNHASISSLRFLPARCSSWHPTNSIKELKAKLPPTVPKNLWV